MGKSVGAATWESGYFHRPFDRLCDFSVAFKSLLPHGYVSMLDLLIAPVMLFNQMYIDLLPAVTTVIRQVIAITVF
jgi:hypothetical protein